MFHNISEKLKTLSPRRLSEQKRNMLWSNIQSSMLVAPKVPNRISKHATAIITGLIIALTGGTTVAFADSAKPGDLLYPVDRAAEEIHLAISFGKEKDALEVSIAKERFQELMSIVGDAILQEQTAHAATASTTTETTASTTTETATSTDVTASSTTETTVEPTLPPQVSKTIANTIDRLQKNRERLLAKGNTEAANEIAHVIDELKNIVPETLAATVPLTQSQFRSSNNEEEHSNTETQTEAENTDHGNKNKNSNASEKSKTNYGQSKKQEKTESDNEDGNKSIVSNIFSYFSSKNKSNDDNNEEYHNNNNNENTSYNDDENENEHEDEGDEHENRNNGKKQEICHNSHTIEVAKQAVSAHLAHGDTLGECGEGNNTPPADTTAPTISNLSAIDITASSSEITWHTNELADSTLYYGTVSPVTAASSTKVTQSTLVENHNIPLTGLSASTTYYYIVVSVDQSGNTATSSEQSFTTVAPADTTAPNMGNISATTTTTTATVAWDTDENATGKILFGTTTPLSSENGTTQIESTSLGISHSVTLTSLTPDTTYYFKLIATDAYNNTATTSEQTFTTQTPADTTAPVISGLGAQNIGSTTADIAWNTDEAATGHVYYGVSSPLDIASSTTEFVFDASYVTSHTFSLTGLVASTTHYYIVVSSDSSGNTATSTEQTFTTN